MRKASGLFRTHSRVKEVGAEVLEAPVIASCVLARLVLEFFFVILFSTTREKLLGRVWFERAPLVELVEGGVKSGIYQIYHHAC